MSFAFIGAKKPYPRWIGPFIAARGVYNSVRVKSGRLIAYFEDDDERAEWEVLPSPGSKSLAKAVVDNWTGGRLLLLPTGHVIKPLQENDERAMRVFIGRFDGPLIFKRHDGGIFDLDEETDSLSPGDPWVGPKGIGLECIIRDGGSLDCHWYHPTDYGQELYQKQLLPADKSLWQAFRLARPNDWSGGRVHVLPNNTVITKDASKSTIFVGKIDPSAWGSLDHWIGGKA
jgi:hypothetical protein